MAYDCDFDKLTDEIGKILFKASETVDTPNEREIINKLDEQYQEALDRFLCIMKGIRNLDGLTREGVRNALGKIDPEKFCGMF